MRLRLVGDIHGDTTAIKLAMTQEPFADMVVQLGDFWGLDWKAYESVSSSYYDRLKILGGNHDEYPVLVNDKHYLGDFGILPGTDDVFFVRGAYSKDTDSRTWGFDWWEEEELTYLQGRAAQDMYLAVKPRIVLSHDCPLAVCYRLHPGRILTSRTTTVLQQMFEGWKPEAWYFGHHHRVLNCNIMGTAFKCLNIDERLDLEV